MSQGIILEVYFFARALFLGVLLALCYDLIRLIRRLIPHGNAVVAAEDAVYWLGCGILIFRMMYEVNSGTIRGFAIIAVVMGMLLCMLLEKLLNTARKKLHNSVKKVIIKKKSV